MAFMLIDEYTYKFIFIMNVKLSASVLTLAQTQDYTILLDSLK